MICRMISRNEKITIIGVKRSQTDVSRALNSLSFPLNLCIFLSEKSRFKIHITIICGYVFISHFKFDTNYSVFDFFNSTQSQWFKFHVNRSKTFSHFNIRENDRSIRSKFMTVTVEELFPSTLGFGCRSLSAETDRTGRRGPALWLSLVSRTPIGLGGADSE